MNPRVVGSSLLAKEKERERETKRDTRARGKEIER
jgi:hypothetical protein